MSDCEHKETGMYFRNICKKCQKTKVEILNERKIKGLKAKNKRTVNLVHLLQRNCNEGNAEKCKLLAKVVELENCVDVLLGEKKA